VNYETRAQRFYQVFEPADDVQPAWRWLVSAATDAGRNDLPWNDVNEVTNACGDAIGALAGIRDAAPDADFRVEANSKIPRAPHRYSGRTAMTADVSMHEPKTTVDDETPFSYSMEGQNSGNQPGAVVPFVWSPGWNSNQSAFKFQQEVNGKLSGGDPGVMLVRGGSLQADVAGRFRNVPDAFAAAGATLLVPVSAIFGSDELSGQSQPILERSAAPTIVLNPSDARRIGASEGAGVTMEGLDYSIEVKVDAAMAEGAAAVTVGLAGGVVVLPRTSVELTVDPDFVRRPGDPKLIARG
jgi:NADH-quinone oxidoreductase subunit G